MEARQHPWVGFPGSAHGTSEGTLWGSERRSAGWEVASEGFISPCFLCFFFLIFSCSRSTGVLGHVLCVVAYVLRGVVPHGASFEPLNMIAMMKMVHNLDDV